MYLLRCITDIEDYNDVKFNYESAIIIMSVIIIQHLERF